MTVFTDNFTGTNGAAPAAPWIVGVLGTAGAGYVQIQNNRLEMNQQSTAYNGQYATYGTTSYGDVDITVKLIIPAVKQEAYPGVGVRLSGGTNGWDSTFGEVFNGYSFWLDELANTFVYQENASGSGTVGGGPVSKVMAANDVYAIRVQAIGTTIQGKAWNTSGSEPGSWDITTTDATWTTGQVGLRGQANFNNYKTMWDDWSLDDLASVSMPLRCRNSGLLVR